MHQTSSKGIHPHRTSALSTCQGAASHRDKIEAHQDIPLEDIDPHGSLKWVLLSCVLRDAAHLVQIIACWLLIKQGDAPCTHLQLCTLHDWYLARFDMRHVIGAARVILLLPIIR